VGFPKDQGRIFLSWRLLPVDPAKVSFNIYRREAGDKDNEFEFLAHTAQTSYIDNNLREGQKYEYTVRSVFDRNLGGLEKSVIVKTEKKEKHALVFDVGQDVKQARVVTGDLNGDGELEVVIAYSRNGNVDPFKDAWQKSEDTIKVAAFLNTGERLWSIDLGSGIEAGAVYSPIVIWDIDADGRAEVILKTKKSDDPLDYGSERLTVLDGETGKIKKETKWPPAEGLHGNYNSNSRNYIAIAHLNGNDPFIIVARGLYKTQRIWAYDNQLNRVWERIIGRDIYIPFTNRWIRGVWRRLFRDRDRGSHSLPIVDINDDGKEEILWGEHCIGEGGKDLWVVKDRMPYFGQPDIVFAADVIPSIRGKEIYYCREGWREKQDNIGMLLVDNEGKTIWAHWGYTHVDGGWVAKLIADQEGLQCFGFDVEKKKWSRGGGVKYTSISSFLWGSDGELIQTPPNSWVWSFPVDWDGDGIREICMMNGNLQKYNGPIIAKLSVHPVWGADLFGDHREEIVAISKGKILILFNTEILESPSRITLAADRQYKNDLSRTAMQFYVYPTEGGYIPKKGITHQSQ